VLAAVAEDEAILAKRSLIVLLWRLPCLQRCTPIITATAEAAPRKKNKTEDCPWIPTLLDQLTNPKFWESWESTLDWEDEKSERRRLGHLCVKSSWQTFATLGFDEHIGSHLSGFFAGLHSEDRAMSEKMPKMSGQRVRLRGFISDSEMTELVVTAKYMKRGGSKRDRCQQ
jgi:hypothetical protein